MQFKSISVASSGLSKPFFIAGTKKIIQSRLQDLVFRRIRPKIVSADPGRTQCALERWRYSFAWLIMKLLNFSLLSPFFFSHVHATGPRVNMRRAPIRRKKRHDIGDWLRINKPLAQNFGRHTSCQCKKKKKKPWRGQTAWARTALAPELADVTQACGVAKS